MRPIRSVLFGALGVAGILAGATVAGQPGSAADHLEAPLVQADGRTDINDLYAFRNGDNTVLIMTVNPGAGVLSPTTFDPHAVYKFRIDNDGDYRADRTIRAKFGYPDAHGNQKVRIRGASWWGADRGRTGEEISLLSGGRAMAGTFDDPFFFDLEGFLGTVKGEGTRQFCDAEAVDFFAPPGTTALDVSAIVVEVPTHLLTNGGDSTINVWVETKDWWGRIDRTGKPAINTVLIDDGNEDHFNFTRPKRDLRKWGDEVSDNLQKLSGLDGDGYDRATADFVTGLLLPDVLTLDTTSDAGFVDGPLNGRRPAEDVIDFELAVVTGLFDEGGNGPVLTTDCVDANNVPFPDGFPYLAPANAEH